MRITKNKIICNSQEEVRKIYNDEKLCWDRTIVLNFSDASRLFMDRCVPYWVKLDTSRVTNMAYMFYLARIHCELFYLDTSNVTNMEYMFAFSTFYKNPLNISNWDISKVKQSIDNILFDCIRKKESCKHFTEVNIALYESITKTNYEI